MPVQPQDDRKNVPSECAKEWIYLLLPGHSLAYWGHGITILIAWCAFKRLIPDDLKRHTKYCFIKFTDYLHIIEQTVQRPAVLTHSLQSLQDPQKRLVQGGFW